MDDRSVSFCEVKVPPLRVRRWRITVWVLKWVERKASL